jgi:hypothetical protein
MIDHHWKKVIRENLHFNRLLESIVGEGDVNKSKVRTELTIEAKFELIRMESSGMLEFDDQNVRLGKSSLELIEFYSNTQFKAVG